MSAHVTQALLRTHFCELALRALVATHHDPKNLRAVLDEAFTGSLSPDAPDHLVHEKNEFLARLHGGFGESHARSK